MNIAEKIRTALRRETSMRHVEQHAPLGYGSDFEKCPNIQCRENAELLREASTEAVGLESRVYVEDYLPVKDALPLITDEWITDGQYCDETIKSLRDALKEALSKLKA